MYLFLLSSLLVVASAQLECPSPAPQCAVDPCEGATCPRYLTADCEANLCHGLCTANFFWRGRNVTDRCPVRRCGEKNCRGNRICVEEATPSSCPDDKPKCRQYLKSRCVIPPPITDCSLLECPQGMVCRKRSQREEVVCVFPRDCTQLKCNKGFECIVENRRALCVPLTTTSPTTEVPTTAVTSLPVTPDPTLCSLLECESFGRICVADDGFPTCAVPTECIPLRKNYCNSFGLVCVERDGSTECDSASSCSDLNCPSGQQCVEFMTAGLAFCQTIPFAESCDDPSLRDSCTSLGQVCKQVNETFATCAERTSCTEEEEENCRNIFSICVLVDGLPSCMPAESCDQIECPPEQGCILRSSSAPTPNGDVAVCSLFQPSCDTLTCKDFCFTQGYPGFDIFLASCTDQDFAESLRSIVNSVTPCTVQNSCNSTSEICVDSRLESGTFVRSLCIPINCNNDSDCPFSIDGPSVCLPVPPSSGVLGVTSVCVPFANDGMFEFGPSCDINVRDCQFGTDSVCSNIVTNGITVGTICDFDVGDRPLFSTSGCGALDCKTNFPNGFCFEQLLDSGERLAQCTSLDDARAFVDQVRVTFGLSLSCDQYPCPQGTVCTEGHDIFGEQTLSCEVAITGESCNELVCEVLFQVCEQVNETFAMCVPPVSCTETLEQECSFNGSVCGVLNGTAVCHPPESCEQLINFCPPQEGCIVRSSNVTPSGLVATCAEFAPSCEVLTCHERSVCISQGFPTFDLFASGCVDIDSIVSVLTIPCGQHTFCETLGQVCVDSRLSNGDLIQSFCVDPDCIGDQSTESSTSSVDSSCFDIDFEFEAGFDCETSGRQCTLERVCTNVDFQGLVFGTMCDFSVSRPTSCDMVDCDGDGECLQSFVGVDIDFVAVCPSAEQTAFIAREIRNVLSSF